MSKRVEDFRSLARDCRKHAKKAWSQEAAEALHRMAKRYDTTADEMERKLPK